jgi:hypothetical protein
VNSQRTESFRETVVGLTGTKGVTNGRSQEAGIMNEPIAVMRQPVSGARLRFVAVIFVALNAAGGCVGAIENDGGDRDPSSGAGGSSGHVFCR